MSHHPIIARVREQNLTFLGVPQLNELYEAVQELRRANRPGIIIEAGCALGGSALVLAQAKEPDRPLYVHDVFGMIPPPSDKDGLDIHHRYAKIKSGKAQGFNGNLYYGYEDNLEEKVRQTFATFQLPVDGKSIILVKGLFQETLTSNEPVALAHIDGDWYESVRTCLEKIGPRLSSGGVMIIDDYYCWSGAKKAVNEFLASHPDTYTTRKRSRLHIIKK